MFSFFSRGWRQMAWVWQCCPSRRGAARRTALLGVTDVLPGLGESPQLEMQ